MTRIICIGSLAKDIFFPTEEGKIIENSGDAKEKQLIAFEFGAKYQIEDRFEALGGCAANVSLGLAKLGLSVAALGRVGQDDLGKEIIEVLKKDNVGINLIQIDPEAKSDLSLILVDKESGERTIFFNRDANENLVLRRDELEGDYFLVSALNGDWKKNMDVIMEVARENQTQIIYNPGQANMKEDLEKVKEFIKMSRVLLLNLDESIEILGQENTPEEMLKNLSQMGPKTVTITLGEKGAIGIDNGRIEKVEGHKVQALDSTGAGDAFISAFVAAHIQGKDFKECIGWGVFNGAQVVKFYGASQGLLNENEIQNKLNSN